MTQPVAVVFCPGRGSYGKAELGTLRRTLRPGPIADALALADETRRAAGQPALADLDAAERFRPGVHLDGVHASELIYFCTLAHLAGVRERYAIAAVAGNSLGWYTALAATGALSPSDGWRLVRTMAALQHDIAGGQVLTTTIDDDWRVDASLRKQIEQIIGETRARGAAFTAALSIELGGHVVIAGTDAAVEQLLRVLPRRRLGEREMPLRLAGHGPFHTELCAPVAERALRELPALDWREPGDWLIDGDGTVLSPWSTDPAALMRYTAAEQTVRTFDFTRAVRSALREFNPDCCVCLGPGESLRAPVGHVLIAAGYRGVHDRDGLFASAFVRTD